MTSLVTEDKLLAEIRLNDDHAYFFQLLENEPKINWLGFAATLYKKNHRTSTITTYAKGIRKFQEMQQESNKTLQKQSVYALADIIAEIQTQQNGLVYKILNDFSTWCDCKGYAPKTTENYVQAVRRLFGFVDIEVDESKFKNKVTMPRKHKLDDDYPTNEQIRKILNGASMTIRTCLQVICDTGLEPIDTISLQVKDFRFTEDPARIEIKRQKTGEKIETFVSKETADAVKQLITFKGKQQTDYVFTEKLRSHSVKKLRARYNLALAKAGFGTIVKTPSRSYHARVDKIEGHKFGKFHLKVFKKRWFSLVVSKKDMPEYVAQAMLGRKQYLDQYYNQPLEKRRELARQVLKTVSIWSDKQDKAEITQQIAKTIGIDPSLLDESKLNAIAGLLNHFAKMPVAEIDKLKALLGGSQA